MTHTYIISYTINLCINGTIKHGNSKQTIDRYGFIICVAGVFLFKELPYNVLKQDQNDIFPENMALWQNEYSSNKIFY